MVADTALDSSWLSWPEAGVVFIDDTWDSVSLPLLDKSREVESRTSAVAVKLARFEVAVEARFVRRHC